MPRKKGSTNNGSSNAPETERQLKELQSMYLEDRGNKEVFDKFFLLLRTYARSLVLKEIKKKGIFLYPERVDEASTDSVLALMGQYSKDDWFVEDSFAGILRFKIYEALYKSKDDEKAFSLNARFNSDDSDSKEVMDLVGSESTIPWDKSSSANEYNSTNPEVSVIDTINISYDEVQGIIDFAYDNLPYPTFMRFLPWLVLQFRKPKMRNSQTLFDSVFLTNEEQNVFDILLLEIRNRIASEVK